MQQANQDRTIAGGVLFIHFILAPAAGLAAVAFFNPASSGLRGTLDAFAAGMRSMTSDALVSASWAAGMAAATWLVIAECRRVGRGFPSRRAYVGAQAKEAARLVLVVAGEVGLIVGFLSLLYAALACFWPDLAGEPPLPLSFSLALPCLAFGGAAYGLGRLRRHT